MTSMMVEPCWEKPVRTLIMEELTHINEGECEKEKNSLDIKKSSLVVVKPANNKLDIACH